MGRYTIRLPGDEKKGNHLDFISNVDCEYETVISAKPTSCRQTKSSMHMANKA